jgi:hypothetical protein
MKYSMPRDKNLADARKSNLSQQTIRHGRTARTLKPGNHAARGMSRVALCLVLLSLGLLFTIYPFSAEGKKKSPQNKGDEIQSTKIEMKPSAIVDFQELARQEALNPQVSEPMPRAITPPKTIEEVDGEIGELPARSAAAQVDVPGPQIPSPGPANNFAALGDIAMASPGTAFFTIPPDTMGAAGTDALNKVFVTLNNNYRIQDKTTGAALATVAMPNFWAPAGAVSPFDPRVQYDRYNDRWIVAAVSNVQSPSTSILVGVSLTNDPGGAYYLFKVPARIGPDPAAVNFADFPMLGFNKNWVVISINMFSTAFSDGRVLVIDYPTLRTGTLSATYFTGVTAANAGFCMHPATTYSATEATEYLVAHLSSGGATYKLDTITGTPSAPVLTIGPTLVRPGGAWVQPSGNLLPQAVGTCATTPMKIEVGDAFVRSNVVFRNSSIWYPQTVGLPAGGPITHTAVQWTQLDPTGAVLQGGRVDDPTATDTNGGKWYAYSSISVNANNDALFGFSQFSSAQFASAGYTYHDNTDAAGTMRDPLIYKTGDDCYSKDFASGRNRWGDYSHTMVDPTDECTFWTIQEYAAPPGSIVGGSPSKWGTWWAKVAALAFCAAPPPILVPAGVTLVNESCQPFNSAVDPGERVSVNLAVINNGGTSTTSLVGTLQASANVLAPDGPKNYGAIPPGGTASRTFSFTANGTCGQTISLLLQLQDGANDLGTVTYTMTLGNPVVTFTENFDGVVAPALPAGWVAANASGPAPLWVTSSSGTPAPAFDTAPNAAFVDDPAVVSDKRLDSPSIAITTASAQLTFQNNFNLETNFDGGVLEISIGGGPFSDIITAGGSFVVGGYNRTISASFGNPLAGRSAWSGSTGRFITTKVNLPAAAAGNSIVLRWRMGSDSSTAGVGWRVDTISITDGFTCNNSCTQARLVVTQTFGCSGSDVTMTICVENQGITAASGVTLTSVTLGASSATSLPGPIPTIAPGAKVCYSPITFTPNPTPGSKVLKIKGTYDGSSTFSKSQSVIVPSCP